MPKLIGQTPPVRRQITGLLSFDKAFNQEQLPIGVPIGTGIEFYGFPHIGKSTFTWSLLGILSALDPDKRGLVICDLEGFDKNFLSEVVSFQGMSDEQTIKICDGSSYKKTTFETVTDEQLLDELIEALKTGEYSGGLLDSIGAISPLSEQEGETGDANMGRRGRIMAQFSRKAMKVGRMKNAPTIIATNHYYENMGGSKGFITPGGSVKNYLFTVRVRLSQVKTERNETGSYVLRGTVDKNRWGGGRDDNKFAVYVQSGKGIHRGLTAVLDLVELGIVEKTTKIKLGDKSWFWRELVEGWNEPELFTPFLEILDKEYSNV